MKEAGRNMDKITITGLHVQGRHGVLAAEHEEPQEFIIDVTLYLDLSDATRSDDLTDTVSYDQIANRIVSVVQGEHVDLIERLAQKIADSVLLSYRVNRVRVTVHKPHAPIAVDFDDVSVTIERNQRTGISEAGEAAASEAGGQASAAGGEESSGATSGNGQADRQEDRGEGHQEETIHQAVISLGSNLGDKEQTLRSAVVALDAIPGNQVTGISPLYGTRPWGMPGGTPDFANAIVLLQTVHTPDSLLSSLQLIESAHGRSHEVHWGSRPLDLDIIDYDGQVRQDPHLTLPHPRAWQRAFVLAPWADIAPEAVLPGEHGGPIIDLLRRAPDRDAVTRVSDVWILGGTA